ncbi:MAG: Dps family protein [Candidatus Izemoplasmataceae bacterium]
MTKLVKLLNQYVADLAVLNTKLHNLHWNVKGERFVPIHEHLEELYDDLFEKYDEVAERIKMLGEYPLASQKSYLETTTVKELENRDYDIDETMVIVKDEVTRLREAAIEIRNLADETGDFVTVAIFEEYVAGYDKELWFINQMLK